MKQTLIGLMLFASCLVTADELKPETGELAKILSSLIVVHEPIHFDEQNYMVKFYGHYSNDHCAVAEYCRGLLELLVITTELDSEGPVNSLYRLPKKHEWVVEKWEHLINHKQGIYLKAITFENNKPNAVATEESFLLSTTWIKAEINAL